MKEDFIERFEINLERSELIKMPFTLNDWVNNKGPGLKRQDRRTDIPPVFHGMDGRPEPSAGSVTDVVRLSS